MGRLPRWRVNLKKGPSTKSETVEAESQAVAIQLAEGKHPGWKATACTPL